MLLKLPDIADNFDEKKSKKHIVYVEPVKNHYYYHLWYGVIEGKNDDHRIYCWLEELAKVLKSYPIWCVLHMTFTKAIQFLYEDSYSHSHI